MNLRYVGSLIG